MFVTCSYSEDTDIINILHEIGMRTFEDVFRENMIRIQDVEDLTDKDFEKLGVTAIGLQLRLKQACRNQRQAANCRGRELNLLTDWLVEHGVYGIIPPYTEHKRDTMVRQLLKGHVYLRIHAEIAQFRRGLNSLEFYTLMKSNSEEMRELFLHTFSSSMITMQKLKEITYINYSEDGSNDKKKEEDTVYAFELFLQDCSEDTSEINLNQLLVFWTGADTIPPLGFHKKLEIFVEDPALLPVAHTCDLSLELSRGETPEEFHRKMELAITCGGEFHLA
uniref:Uncharacterized protein LOC111134287 n=1 Tax=Crassostrea virginica TaxID=6565 RepID=A0A8B8EFM0_CRAVI|nr:uncharacterized protein LOC111134287 [Crassostrea virginica]